MKKHLISGAFLLAIFISSCSETKEKNTAVEDAKVATIDSITTVVKSSKDSVQTKVNELDQSLDELSKEFKLEETKK